MNILLTGINGYINNSFYKKYQNTYNIKKICLRNTDISKIDLSSFDIIIHLSGIVHKKEIPEKTYVEVNTNLTVNLAILAKQQGVKHFIYFSTVAVYGINGYLDFQPNIINEKTTCNPLDFYAKSKLLAEKKLNTLQDENFIISIIRPPIVYGYNAPGNMNKLKNLVLRIPILPFKNINNQRSIIGINNLLHFMDLVIQKRARGIFIPQDALPYATKNLILEISTAYKKSVFICNMPSSVMAMLLKYLPKQTQSLFGTLVFDTSDSNKTLNFTPPFSTAEELKNMCQ